MPRLLPLIFGLGFVLWLVHAGNYCSVPVQQQQQQQTSPKHSQRSQKAQLQRLDSILAKMGNVISEIQDAVRVQGLQLSSLKTSTSKDKSDFETKSEVIQQDDAFRMLLAGIGLNNNGEVGDNTTILAVSPVSVLLPPSLEIKQFAAGLHSSLAVLSDGLLYRWGQFLDPAHPRQTIPVLIASISSTSEIKSLCAGLFFSIVVLMNGDVFAWGLDPLGEIAPEAGEPVQMNPKLFDNLSIDKVACKYSTSAYLSTSSGVLWMTGSDLGSGMSAASSTPQRVTFPTTERVIDVVIGGHHAIAITSNGHMFGWGSNTFGQIGDGTVISRDEPAPIATHMTVTSVACGHAHTLALGTNGELFSWGWNEHGTLCDGTLTTRLVPMRVDVSGEMRNRRITAVEAGYVMSWFVTDTEELFACGLEMNIGVGTGLSEPRTRPVRINTGVVRGKKIKAMSSSLLHALVLYQ